MKIDALTPEQNARVHDNAPVMSWRRLAEEFEAEFTGTTDHPFNKQLDGILLCDMSGYTVVQEE